MARAPFPIPRPLNIGGPQGMPPMIGGLGLPPELMNPRPMTPQGPGIAPPTFTRNMPQNAPQLPSAPPQAMGASAMPMSAPSGGGGMGSRIGDFLGSDAALALSAGILEGGTTSQALGRGMGYALAARQAAQKPTATTDDIQEYAFAKQQGYEGNFTDFMMMTRKAGATTIDNRSTGPLEKGYMYEWDENGNPVRMSPIPGGPADTSEADAAAAEGKARQADIVTQDIDRALTIIESSPGTTTGMGGALLQNIPETSARDVKALIDTVKSNVGFDKLQAMREASPTGGALGQVSERENALLQATIGNLEQSQTTEQLRDNLNRVWNVYQDIVHGPGNGPPRRQLGFNGGGGQSGDWQDLGNGIRVRELP